MRILKFLPPIPGEKHELHVRVENAGDGDKSEINEFYYWIYCFQDHPSIQTPRVRKLKALSDGSSRVDLQWAAAPVANQVNYYQIERSEQPDFSHPIPVGRSNTGHFSDSRVKPSTTYYYRAAAVGLSRVVGPFSKSVKASTAADTQTPTAAFLGMDESTMGNWPTNNTYGTDGFIMLSYFYGRNCQALPDYVCAVDYGSFTNQQLSLWKNATSLTLLTSPISYCARYLGALETSASDSLTLYVNDARPHQLALYVCDYNKAGREETVDIEDLQGHALVPALHGAQ